MGKRDFNSRMEKKLSKFIRMIHNMDYTFTDLDFRDFPLEELEGDSFIYADPPYLITCATYNERSGWGEQDERDLLEFLDRADRRGIRFALSNVMKSKGKTNSILMDWAKENKGRYRVIHLDYDYGNSNYQTKNKGGKADEVLIVNYRPPRKKKQKK